MARLQVAGGAEGLQIGLCRVAAKILNKQARISDRRWLSRFEIKLGPENSRKNGTC